MISRWQKCFSKRCYYKKKKNNPPNFQSILPVLNKVADDLSQADCLLSETILNETKQEIENLEKNGLNKKQKKLLKTIQKKIEKAEDYLEEAKEQRLEKNYSKSISYFTRSWIFSKQAKHTLDLFLNKKGE